jgi:hypothetical protein
MKIKTFKNNTLHTLLSAFAPLFFTLTIILLIAVGLSKTETASRAEGARYLEESILRAAIHSYAVEGQYPENLIYIVENYGIFIDRRKYVVHYEIFGSNILPNITVITLNR